jgi:hypothetical protein
VRLTTLFKLSIKDGTLWSYASISPYIWLSVYLNSDYTLCVSSVKMFVGLTVYHITKQVNLAVTSDSYLLVLCLNFILGTTIPTGYFCYFLPSYWGNAVIISSYGAGPLTAIFHLTLYSSSSFFSVRLWITSAVSALSLQISLAVEHLNSWLPVNLYVPYVLCYTTAATASNTYISSFLFYLSLLLSTFPRTINSKGTVVWRCLILCGQ